MKYCTVTIGNSDNKLTQQEWSDFWHAVDDWVTRTVYKLHISGVALPTSRYQNAIWSFDITDEYSAYLLIAMAGFAKEFRQDAIAVHISSHPAEMVKPR